MLQIHFFQEHLKKKFIWKFLRVLLLKPQKSLWTEESIIWSNQSPRPWFVGSHRAMIKFGYNQGQADHTIFITQQGGNLTVLTVYVDDIILTWNDEKEISDLTRRLAMEFEKDLGSLRYFLGIEMAYPNKRILLPQSSMLWIYFKKPENFAAKPINDGS